MATNFLRRLGAALSAIFLMPGAVRADDSPTGGGAPAPSRPAPSRPGDGAPPGPASAGGAKRPPEPTAIPLPADDAPMEEWRAFVVATLEEGLLLPDGRTEIYSGGVMIQRDYARREGFDALVRPWQFEKLRPHRERAIAAIRAEFADAMAKPSFPSPASFLTVPTSLTEHPFIPGERPVEPIERLEHLLAAAVDLNAQELLPDILAMERALLPYDPFAGDGVPMVPPGGTPASRQERYLERDWLAVFQAGSRPMIVGLHAAAVSAIASLAERGPEPPERGWWQADGTLPMTKDAREAVVAMGEARVRANEALASPDFAADIRPAIPR